MVAYFYLGLNGQNEIHEMVHVNDIPQCGDLARSQNGVRAVVPSVIVDDDDAADPFRCPVEVYCNH